jgi:hypothetical protein
MRDWQRIEEAPFEEDLEPFNWANTELVVWNVRGAVHPDW